MLCRGLLFVGYTWIEILMGRLLACLFDFIFENTIYTHLGTCYVYSRDISGTRIKDCECEGELRVKVNVNVNIKIE